MAKDKYYGKTLRKNFARHQEVMAMPNLLEIQKKSYQWFLDTGLREVFADVASIGDYAGNLAPYAIWPSSRTSITEMDSPG